MAVTRKELMARFDTAKTKRSNWDNLYQECYRYAIPHRDTFYNVVPGKDKNFDLYDSTAIDSTSAFANLLSETITPPEFRWFEYAVGPDIPNMMKERVQFLLDGVTEKFFYLLNMTNFDTESNQAYHDLAAGTGSLAIRDFDDVDAPATFSAVPPSEIYIAEGREGIIDTVFRLYKMEPRKVKITWPNANFDETKLVRRPNTAVGSASATGQGTEQELEILEALYYDYDEKKFKYQVYLMDVSEENAIVDDELIYNSWVVFRWAVVSGEIYGRGPLISALADIKSLNKSVEMVLQNASLAIAGVYTGVDDGILNPETVEISPGVIIPVAFNGGQVGRSLDVLPRSGDFSIAELVLDDLRQSIRRKLLDDDFAPLDDAVRSSAEVAARQQRAMKKAGPNFGRVKIEMITNLVTSLTKLWQAKGELPPFEIDGKQITLRFTSPISKFQNNEDLQNLDAYLARMNGLQPGFGPIVVKPEEYAHFVAEKSGIPIKLINSRQDLLQAQQNIGNLIAEGGPEGQAVVEGFTKQ